MPMKPPHRRRPASASIPPKTDQNAAIGAVLGAMSAARRRGTFRQSPFIAGCFVHVDLDDPQLFPEVHGAARAVMNVFAVIQSCGIAERRQRLAASPTEGVTFGPLATPYVPAFDHMAEVSEQLNRLATASATWYTRGDLRSAHNREVLADLVVQAAGMNAALCAHCADATDVPAECAAAFLDQLEALFSA